MILARKKICLQIPADAKPDDWPIGWDFPPLSAWPPGYPRMLKDFVTLDATFTPEKVLSVWCLDKHGEHTDVLMGQSLLVKACDGAKQYRLRLPGTDHWSEYAIIKVSEFEPSKWGIHANLEIEGDNGEVDIQVLLFGYEQSGVLITVKS